jgi:hypothetical protein
MLRITTLLAALAIFSDGAAAADNAAWRSMFDGKTLNGWREASFGGHGSVRVENGAIVLNPGSPMTGVNYTGEFPRNNYELRFEAARIEGGDFFASLTFPVGDSFCTWVLGGWGGDIVGLSSIDGWDASENETRSYVNFDYKRWYAMRLEVTPERIKAWIDQDNIISVPIAGRSITLRHGDIKLSTPFGFASYNTTGGVRKIEYRVLGK